MPVSIAIATAVALPIAIVSFTVMAIVTVVMVLTLAVIEKVADQQYPTTNFCGICASCRFGIAEPADQTE
jgi:hypothetical protein